MPEFVNDDPRYHKWKQRLRTWYKSNTHLGSDPFPITPDEAEELEDIFRHRTFVLLGTTNIVMFGAPDAQQFEVIGWSSTQPAAQGFQGLVSQL